MGIQFPFSNKVLHSIPLKVYPDSKSRLIGSSGFLSGTTPESNNIQDELDAYPLQNDVQHTHHLKMFPVSNQAISISVTNSFFKNHLPTRGLNLTGGSTMKQQQLGRIPMNSTPSSVVPAAASTGTLAKPTAKDSGSSAQLTIFYGGKVNVYHDITPEKAQAIMLSASKGLPLPKLEIHQPVNDSIYASQPMQLRCSGLPSPLSVSSQSGTQSRSGSTTTDESFIARGHQVVATPINKMEAPKSVNTVGLLAAANLMPSAIPQARKASLARFLEKRKERVMNAAPYNLNLKTLEFAA
ncbi:hypothetical protein ACFE04_018446 [Oxalis oulophora]